MKTKTFTFCIKTLCLILVINGFVAQKSFAQLKGIYTINPALAASAGNYKNFASAVNDLSGSARTDGGPAHGPGVSGRVTFRVAAGAVFNESTLTINIPSNKPTGANPVVFKKWGAGGNPQINVTGTSSNYDAGFLLVGTDYTTFDGLTIIDAGTSSSNYTDIGFALARASTTDGCQYDTIRNCTISLNQANINTSSSSYWGSVGIYQGDRNAAWTGGYDPTSASGEHSYNSYYNNTILNVMVGVYFEGGWGSSSALSAGVYYDTNNDAGVKGGNTIVVGGPDKCFEVDGLQVYNQQYLQVANNKITSAAGNNSPYSEAILDFSGINNTESYFKNTLSLSTLASSDFGDLEGYEFANDALVINFYDNIIENYSVADSTLANYGSYNLIDGQFGLPQNLNVYNNVIRNNTNNLSSDNLELNGFYSYNSSTCNANIYGNKAYNNTSKTVFTMLNLYGSAEYEIYSNEMYNDSAQTLYPLQVGGNWGNSGDRYDVYNNSFHDLVATGSIYGIYTYNSFSAHQSVGLVNNIHDNQFYNFTAPGGSYAAYLTYGNAYNLYSNKIYSFNSNKSSCYGFYITSSVPHLSSVYNNFVSDLNAPGGYTITGLYLDDSVKVYFNSIYLNQTAAGSSTFSAVGLYLNGAYNDVENNLVVNTSTPGASGYTTALEVEGSSSPYNNYAATSNYNSYYNGSSVSNNYIFYNTGGTYQTLSAFQTAVSPRDANSISADAAFVSADNLHISSGSASLVQGKGIYLSKVTTDIDGQTRANPPCVGADEVYNNADMGIVSLISPVPVQCFNAAANIIVTVENYSSSTINFATTNSTINYSVTGTNTSGLVVSGSFTINSGSLASGDTMDVTIGTDNMTSGGTYIFNAVITTPGDINTTNDTLKTVTLSILPPVTVTADTNNVCAGGSTSIVLDAYGASSYTWAPPTNLSTDTGSWTIATPTASVTYTVTGTQYNGCTSTASITINTQPAPTFTISKHNASCSSCSDGSAKVNITSGTAPYTYLLNNTITTDSLINLLPGNYQVCVTDSFGCTTCDSLTISYSTGINQVNNNSAFEIYPNPTNGLFFVKLNGVTGSVLVQLYSITGQLLVEQNISGNVTAYFDLSNYAKGIYMLEVTSGNEVQRQKLVIQ